MMIRQRMFKPPKGVATVLHSQPLHAVGEGPSKFSNHGFLNKTLFFLSKTNDMNMNINMKFVYLYELYDSWLPKVDLKFLASPFLSPPFPTSPRHDLASSSSWASTNSVSRGEVGYPKKLCLELLS